MKRLLLATSCALLLLSSTAALAHDGHDRHEQRGNDRDHHDQRGNDRDWHANDRDRRGNDRDWHDRRDNDRDWRGHDGRHDNGRHLGQARYDFRRGQHVPVVYLQPRYYVNDYRAYHLAPPRRGYRWIRPDDGRFLLVATTTGLIADILLGR